jgi:superfamily I DNA/RNA helicase
MNSIFREIFPQYRTSDSLKQLTILRAKLLKNVELEQSKIVDLVEDNPNIFITGHAGSGKSHLLAQLAINSAKKGHQVLLTCHGVMMADWLESRIGPNPNIKVINLGQLMLEYSGKTKHKETSIWYEETLPTLALEAIKNKTARAKYSAIVIDEFQDIAANPLKIQFLKSIQTQILGRRSRFIFAGDDQQQILSDNEIVESFEIAEKLSTNLTLLRLNQNCRQTPHLAHDVYRFLARPYPFREERLRTDLDSGLEIISCDETNQARRLLLVTERLRKEFPDNNMRILCFENEKSVLGQIFAKDEIKDSNEKKLSHLFKEKVKNPLGPLRWRSIRKYKGLDDDVVIITDVSRASEQYIAKETGKTMKDWLYVGMTRARFKVVLLVQDDLFAPTHNSDGSKFVTKTPKGS